MNYCTYCVYTSQILILFKNSEIPVWCSQSIQLPLIMSIPLLPLNKHSNWTKPYFWIYRFHLSYITYVGIKAHSQLLKHQEPRRTAMRSNMVQNFLLHADPCCGPDSKTLEEINERGKVASWKYTHNKYHIPKVRVLHLYNQGFWHDLSFSHTPLLNI